MRSSGVNGKTLLCLKLDNFFPCVLAIWIFLYLTFFCSAWINKYDLIPLTVFLISLFRFFSSVSNLSFSWFFFRRELLSNLLQKAFTLLLSVYSKLKNKNFGITLNFLQFNEKFTSEFPLLTLRDNISSFQGLLIGSTPPYLFVSYLYLSKSTKKT